MGYYDYATFLDDSKCLSDKIESRNPEALLAIARGGLTLAHFIAMRLEMRALYSVNAISYNETLKLDTIEIFNLPDLSEYRRVMVIDDIADSGRTLNRVLQTLKKRYPSTCFESATLFFKPEAEVIPDISLHEAKEWITFFWEVDGIK